MKRMMAYLIKYPVWVTVIMFSVIIFGLISVSQLRFSFFPESIPRNIAIDVTYRGASPDEVAEGVILKIEENLDGLLGVERITSISKENFGRVNVETMFGYDVDKVLTDVKNAVDRINSFPEDVEQPVIYKQEFQSLSLVLGLYGDADLYNLKYIAEDFRDQLLATEEISQVELEGIPSLEFSIEVSEANMRRYNITFNEISQAVNTSNVNISGGKFDTQDEEILIRAWGRQYYAEDILNIPIRGNADGTYVLLRDIAEVHEQWEDVPDKSYYNGQYAISFNVIQTESEDILAIADRAKLMMNEFNETHSGMEMVPLRDMTVALEQRLDLLVKNGLIGMILVLICLGFFLNLRLSFWVAASIPFSFAGMFIIAAFVGITINIMTLAAMIIVVGILVDDAIVVGENIFAHYERGESALQAALNGASEVIAPVTTSVLTTIIIFVAFFFLQGRLGEMMWQLGLVVAASLIFSLIEAFTILPSHLAHSKGLNRDVKVNKYRAKVESWIAYVTNKLYAPMLKASLRNKWAVVVTPLAALFITIGLLGGGLIGVTFFPNVDGDEVPINVSLVAGSQEADTDSLLASLETIIWQINDELKDERVDGKDVVESIQRQIGFNQLGESGSHVGQLFIKLLDGEERNMESFLIANRIRDKVGDFPKAQKITFGNAGHFGKAVSISFLGKDMDVLEKAVNVAKERLSNYSTLKDITDTNQKGRKEIDITLKPLAHSLGLTLQDVVGQVRQGYFGQEIQRIQRGRDEIRVWVRYRPEDRTSLTQLDKMRIRTPMGNEYPFGELADYSIKRGITQISHLDRKNELKVEANQASLKDDLPKIIEEIQTDVIPEVLAQFPGVSVQFEGQSREQEKMLGSMIIAFSVAFLCMLILMVLVFRSYAQAVVIFSLIPIGIIGAIWGHGIQGIQISLLSAIGVMALSGVIVNDSIVLVDQMNRYLRDGQKMEDAVFNAGLARLRPILLTTLTTSLGMAPLILETSRQAQFLIPMAASIAYGLMFGSFILLILLPCQILALNTIRLKVMSLFFQGTYTRESVEPAVKELKNNLVFSDDGKETEHV